MSEQEETVAESIRPGMRKDRFREKIREVTGDRHREVQVDEQTWDYLMDLKKLFGLDNMRQTMVLVRHLSIYGAKRREEGVVQS